MREIHNSPVETENTDPLNKSENSIGLGAGIDFADPDSRLAPFYLKTNQVVAVGLFCAWFVFLNFVPLRQTDVWGHLKFGQYIFENKQLPPGNPFCPMLVQEIPSNYYCWLSQTLFYGIYHLGELMAGGSPATQMAGGVDLLRFSHALLIVARLVLFWLAFQRLTGSYRMAMIGVLITFLINLGGHLVIFRPQVISELCFAALLFALSKSPISIRAGIGSIVLMVLWANLHGSFVIGLAMLGCCLLGRIISTGWELQTPLPLKIWADPQVKRLTIITAATVAGIAFLNPAGPGIFQQTLNMTRHPVVLKMDEWAPMQLIGGQGGQYGFAITLVLLVGSLIYSRGRITPTAVLLIVVFGIQPIFHQRSLLWWYAILPWIILPMWIRRESPEEPSWADCASEANFRKTLLAGSLVVVSLLWSIPSLWIIDGHPSPVGRSVSQGTAWQLAFQLQGIGENTQPWLPELEKWTKENYPQGKFRGIIFTSETSGDYLAWALPKEMPVFVYAHVHLFTEEYWQLVAAVRNGSSHWRTVLDHAKINLLVVEPELNTRLRDLLYQDKEWYVLYDETDDSRIVDYRCRLMIAVRRKPLF